jgi:hypothetical protein
MSNKRFAGYPSLGTLDESIMDSLSSGELTVDQAISLRIIKASVRDYLYFGIGPNGITPEGFMDAYEYLYKVRSNTFGEDSEGIKLRCFDVHYYISGLSNTVPIVCFLEKLKKKRESIINGKYEQILSYMEEYRIQEWNTLGVRERKGQYSFPRIDVIHTLSTPKDIMCLARLYLYGRDVDYTKKKELEKTLRTSVHLEYKTTLFPEGI